MNEFCCCIYYKDPHGTHGEVCDCGEKEKVANGTCVPKEGKYQSSSSKSSIQVSFQVLYYFMRPYAVYSMFDKFQRGFYFKFCQKGGRD